MKIKASETTMAQLDYLVAVLLCLPVLQSIDSDRITGPRIHFGYDKQYRRDAFYYFTPTTDWAQGGPLIGQHQVMFETAGEHEIRAYFKSLGTAGPTATGPTHLIAAMRLLVEGSYSEVVEIPEELA